MLNTVLIWETNFSLFLHLILKINVQKNKTDHQDILSVDSKDKMIFF